MDFGIYAGPRAHREIWDNAGAGVLNDDVIEPLQTCDVIDLQATGELFVIDEAKLVHHPEWFPSVHLGLCRAAGPSSTTQQPPT